MKTLTDCFNLIFLILLFSCMNAQEKKIPFVSVKKIVEYQANVVDFDLETFFKITCGGFEKTFKQTMESKTIRDKNKIKELQDILDSLKDDPEKYHPDVRGQLLIRYDNNTIDTLCLSKLGLELNGRPKIHDDRILQLIGL